MPNINSVTGAITDNDGKVSTQSLLAQMRKLADTAPVGFRPGERDYIVCHPDHRPNLAEIMGIARAPAVAGLLLPELTGIPIRCDEHVPKFVETGKILFPQSHPWVEYEASDVAWALPLGLAVRETVPGVFYCKPAELSIDVLMQRMGADALARLEAEIAADDAKLFRPNYRLYGWGR